MQLQLVESSKNGFQEMWQSITQFIQILAQANLQQAQEVLQRVVGARNPPNPQEVQEPQTKSSSQ